MFKKTGDLLLGRPFLKISSILLFLFIALFWQTASLSAVAAWVSHEGNIAPSAPTSSDAVDFWVQVGYQGWVTDVRLYYTTDGSEPSINNSTHAPLGTTQMATMNWSHNEGNTLWYKATVGPWSHNTVVRYKIGAWHSGGGDTKYADSTDSWPVTNPDDARIFGFRVGENQLPSWTNTAVIYNVFVDRFWDGDTANNDYCAEATNGYCDHNHVVSGALPANPQDDYRYTYNGGDLDGVIDRLDYLADLGINVLWLSPVFDNPNFYTDTDYNTNGDIYFTYHGYHPSDPESVEEVFGTQQDLEDLVDIADTKGIRVILDFVPNHTSSQHGYFSSASTNCSGTYLDWYTFSNCNSAADPTFSLTFPSGFNTSSANYTVYGSNDTNKSFFGVLELPQVNNDNTAARNWVINDRAVSWINTLGHAGYRLDYAPGPSTDFWREFNDSVGTNETFTIAEIWLNNGPEMIRRQIGRVDSAMDFEANAGMVGFFTNGDSVDALDATLQDRASFYYQDGITASEFVRGCFIDNHDMDRFAHRVNYDVNQMKLGALLMFTQPCVPVMYYGNEIGLGQEFGIYHFGGGRPEYARERMAWGFYDSSAPAEWQGAANATLWNYYQDLIDVRTNTTALQSFDPAEFVTVYRHNGDRTYAYLRGGGADSVLVALNESGSNKTLTVPNIGTLPYANGTQLTDLLGSGISCTVTSGQCSVSLNTTTPGVILAPATSSNVTVDFTVNGYVTGWGQEMYVVGNVPELGNWNPANAVKLNWVDSDTWSGPVTFTSSTGQPIEFKFIVRQGGSTIWEGGSNRSYTVPSSGTGSYSGNWQ
ncbi:MAG: alpha-amylase family glycosyl hydrolase [Chloroflexota bacterium]